MEKSVIKKYRFFNSWIWKISLIESILFILIAIFRWYIFEETNIFLGVILFFFVFISLFISVIITVIMAKRYKFNIFFSLFLYLLTIYTLVFDPFSGIVIDRNFKQNLKDREDIVTQVKKGNLKKIRVFDTRYLATLPKDKKRFSSDGVVFVTNDGKNIRVLFYTFRGVLDNFSGFIYTQKVNDPSPKSFGCDPIQTEKKTDNWYWVSCN